MKAKETKKDNNNQMTESDKWDSFMRAVDLFSSDFMESGRASQEITNSDLKNTHPSARLI